VSVLHVVFQVGGAEYALPAAQVLHMETYGGATPVPGAAPFVLGLVQVRSRVVPVIDLRVRFGLPAVEPTLDSRVVVTEHAERVVGLLVDRGREVLKLEVTEEQATPRVLADEAHGFVRAVARTGGRLILLLDLPRVLGEEPIHDATHAALAEPPRRGALTS
jgi:purine-binding chemotaxis protein CheW